MVGIILASHGGFAEGIYQSGEMIFGKQENVKACILKPSEGPDDIRKKMEDAIASFDDPEQVLFLIDLWSGTPFNQASNLFAEHKDTWAIVTGLNLPMLIEAYGARLQDGITAREIAKQIVGSAKDGIKTLPEGLVPKKEAPKAAESKQPTGAIPEGTVLGDGHIKYGLVRIDSRLLHGQVATAWTKSVRPDRIIVVSDNVSKDKLRKNMIIQAAPPGVRANVVPIKKMIEVSKDPRFGATKALVLFENPEDALKAIEGGVDIKTLNIGSMAHSEGKVAVNKVLSLNEKDVETYDKLNEMGIKFDVRKVPNDSPENMMDLVNKAREELAKKK
ncbi:MULTISPECIES: PTS sugar transporter subunit IIB [Ligilactobacillus]|uniref:PTS system mannose-specific EIIAB component n=1 Tax=Ligilactobacillus aviarius TaxID=1606 RepID=A0A179CUX8_9LACO|nr:MULTISPECIES: PTS sugar transporter subunit IIB [Ligilactobacillus]MBM6862787.1 PTS mannose transporter subunit IIAB [Ligilactobacillus aviarius]MDM8279016.1 PTS sugar transporter subunit IIB [Ligilactobacillus aviarius]MDO3394042.1 PTS sugar transporter subunit IIB [Ligilactobacillus sp. 110_WCHN]OAP98439.1 PTS mannose transporter subunit EIIAB [Ligilactobacillus aviarius]OAP99463.1 PTS mannose transporter subunit EIIAB [Ligilactobacillus aviarius]